MTLSAAFSAVVFTMPEEPAAQCDELVSLLKSMTEAVLGPGTDVEVNHIVIHSMRAI